MDLRNILLYQQKIVSKQLIYSNRNSPAAMGIPITLYIVAAKKLIRILHTVFFDKVIAATTSKRSF